MNNQTIIGARLYIKPGVIGLEFSEPKDRDNFWTLLGENRGAASLFGKKSVRLHPDKAQRLFHVPLFTDKIAVIEPEPTAQPKSEPIPVSVTALKAPEPIPAMGKLPPEVTGIPETVQSEAKVIASLPEETIDSLLDKMQTIDSLLDKMQPPSKINIPEVTSVIDPKPVGVHHMSKEMREWRARNPKA